MKRAIIILTLCFVSLSGFSQLILLNADTTFKKKNYSKAIRLYEKSLTKISDNEKNTEKRRQIYYNMAECYRLTNNYSEAKDWYKKALKNGYKQPSGFYHFADMLMRTGDYINGAKFFKGYLRIQPNDKLARKKLASCKFALKTHIVKTLYQIKNVAELNTEFSEFGHTKVFKKIIFSSSRINSDENQKSNIFKKIIKGELDIYSYNGQGFSNFYETSYNKSGNTWDTPYKCSGGVSSPYNEGTISFNERAKTAYYMQCNGFEADKEKCNIYSSYYNKNNSTWDDPQILSFCNDEYSTGHPSISYDGKTIYFVSDMEGGYGGTDIWMAQRSRKTKPFGKPVNLGPKVNTSGDEMFPYVLGDTVLYFSSDGHLGFGGLDIFYVKIIRKIETKKFITTENFDLLKKKAEADFFTKPKNLNIPFNSSGDDFGILYLSPDSGLFCSNRIGGKGDDDIYSFGLQNIHLKLKGRISYHEKSKNINNSIVILKGSDGSIDSTLSDNKGFYVLEKIKPDVEYELSAYKYGYLADMKKFSTIGLIDNIDYSLTKEYLIDLNINESVNRKLGLEMNFNLSREVGILLPEEKEKMEEETIKDLNRKANEMAKIAKKKLITEPKPKPKPKAKPIPKPIPKVVKKEAVKIEEIVEADEALDIEDEIVDNESELEVIEEPNDITVDFDFALKELTKKEIEIPNVYYDLNKWSLKESSKKEIDKLVTVLKINTNVKILVNSHTDERGAEYYNLFLSQNRAKAVVDYLVSKGIRSSRLSFKGWGETRPIIENAGTEREHQLNRRTSFTIQNIDEIKEKTTSKQYYTATDKLKEKKETRPAVIAKNNVEFRLQFASSAKILSPIFYKKLENSFPMFKIKYYRNTKDGMYKYTIGSFSDYSSVDPLRKRLRDMGYKSFMVAFNNGASITITEAKQLIRKEIE